MVYIILSLAKCTAFPINQTLSSNLCYTFVIRSDCTIIGKTSVDVINGDLGINDATG